MRLRLRITELANTFIVEVSDIRRQATLCLRLWDFYLQHQASQVGCVENQGNSKHSPIYMPCLMGLVLPQCLNSSLHGGVWLKALVFVLGGCLSDH